MTINLKIRSTNSSEANLKSNTTRKHLALCASGVLACFSDTAGAAIVWNLADDFSLTSNPNGAWTYQLEVTAADDDTAHTPLDTNSLSATTLWGTAFTAPPTMRSESSGFWGIGRNDTGVTQTTAQATWDPGEVLFHPKPDCAGSGGRFVITWTAPIDMVIDVDWSYAKRMSIGATGVGMGVLHESGGANSTLRAFANPEGASETFEFGAGFTNDGEFEFIELKNIGPAAIDIGGVRFESGIDFVVPGGTMLAGGEIAVAVSNQSAFEERYGTGVGIRILGQYSGRLSNDGEEVLLRDAVGENILKFTYNDR